ncbi:MAG TPA: aminotransferase [Steroidobacteraceae bacterium]|nr:aminotransferase [Steroidobacteraceae bacterium]
MPETNDTSLEAIDRRSLIHPFTNLKRFGAGELGGPRIITGGSGIRVRDRNGRESIDAFAGLYCVNVGYGRQEIADAIHAQASQLAYYHNYAAHSNEPAIRLSERVLALAPAGMSRIFYGLSGSDANETQVKIAWYYNNVLGRKHKKKIISRTRGYHGATIMSGSLTGLPLYHNAFDLPVSLVHHTTAPHAYWQAPAEVGELEFSRRCAADLESLIRHQGADTIAAFIAEPVLGTGGLIPPPQGYWTEIQRVLKRHDILLIADEVICGFGRTGANFGCDLYGIEPDLITVAKGLTSGYLPLSAAIVSDKVARVLEQGSDQFGMFSHGYTYTAHPLCAAAALANLAIIDREGLTANARDAGEYLQRSLRQAFGGMRHVAEVRGVGLLAAIEFALSPAERKRFPAEAQVGAKLAAACLERGVISRAMPHGDILGLAPPLIVTHADIDEIVGRMLEAVRATNFPD